MVECLSSMHKTLNSTLSTAERDTKRERNRQTDRQTHTHTHTHRDSERGKEWDTETQRRLTLAHSLGGFSPWSIEAVDHGWSQKAKEREEEMGIP
jgi:hypothetical protein